MQDRQVLVVTSLGQPHSLNNSDNEDSSFETVSMPCLCHSMHYRDYENL